MRYPPHLLKLIGVLRKLPGVGNKSAERFAFQMLAWTQEQLDEMSHVIRDVPHRLRQCNECGCLMGEEACVFCPPAKRNANVICVIASPRDAFSVEETREYHGLYHVLGGLLSPMEGFHAEKLTIQKLIERINRLQAKEVIIALDSTLEGDATALYLKRELGSLSPAVSTSRLAFGLPMGSSLDYVDGGTLARAMSGRATF